MTCKKNLYLQSKDFYNKNDYICAHYVIKKYCSKHPNNLLALQLFGEAQRMLYMVSNSLATLKTAYTKVNKNHKVFVAGTIGFLLSNHISLKTGELWYKKSMDSTKKIIDWVWVFRGSNLVQMGKHKKGLLFLEKAIRLGCKDKGEAYIHMAIAKRALGLYDDARRYAILAKKENPCNEISNEIISQVDSFYKPRKLIGIPSKELFRVAKIAYEKDDLIFALDLFNEIIKNYPNNLRLLHYIGCCQQDLFRVKESFFTLTKIYKKANKSRKFLAAASIADLLSKHYSLKKSEIWYKKSMNTASYYVDWIWVLRGVNLVTMGKPKKGIPLLEVALKIGCEDICKAYLGLAAAKRTLGLNSDARRYATLVLAVDEENALANEIIAQVDSFNKYISKPKTRNMR